MKTSSPSVSQVGAPSKKMVRAAQRAAALSAKAGSAHAAWVELFEKHYGHSDISDALVEIIDYSTGSMDVITAEYIHANSKPGKS